MTSQPDWRTRLVSADEAIEAINKGNRVFVGSACATPRALLHALETTERALSDLTLVHFLNGGEIPVTPNGPRSRYRHRVLFVGQDDRSMVATDRADYVPISLPQAAQLFRMGRYPLDVALVQVSSPDEAGYCSLGVSADLTWTAIQTARRVIAEINPNMPRPKGPARVSIDEFDHIVEVDSPVIEYLHPEVGDVARQIARYVARIIDDGSTLQIGLGKVPNEMLRYLANRTDLGIHSDVITEPLVDLVERGVVTGAHKSLDRDKVVASYCMGTRRLYDLIDDNEQFELRPIEDVADPSLIARHYKMVSVSQAFAVDLTGQICADQYQGEFYGGVSCQPQFLQGAAASPDGKAIVCLASLNEQGQSRIRPMLHEGEGVTIARSDVHYLVTEYGIAYLFGKSIHERALAIIGIAHPDFRDELIKQARDLSFVGQKEALKSKTQYPDDEERTLTLHDGSEVLLRPAKASDLESMRALFHSLTTEDVTTRFFTNLQSFSDSKAQHLCNVSYEDEMSFVAVIGEDFENETVIGNACYYLDNSTGLADVAYMVHPDWQKKGLGTALQRRLIEYAKVKSLRGFTADVLLKNEKMLAVFEKAGLHVNKQVSAGVVEVVMTFDPPSAHKEPEHISSTAPSVESNGKAVTAAGRTTARSGQSFFKRLFGSGD